MNQSINAQILNAKEQFVIMQENEIGRIILFQQFQSSNLQNLIQSIKGKVNESNKTEILSTLTMLRNTKKIADLAIDSAYQKSNLPEHKKEVNRQRDIYLKSVAYRNEVYDLMYKYQAEPRDYMGGIYSSANWDITDHSNGQTQYKFLEELNAIETRYDAISFDAYIY